MASSDPSETKTFIRNVLTSNPSRCTIQQLCKDFYNILGFNIPFRKLGFPNAEEYLRSIPDTVQVIGSGLSAEVEAVSSKKSKHIDVLVAKQRKDNIPAYKRKSLKHQNNSYAKQWETVKNDTSGSSQDEYRSRIPKLIQNNLRKLILKFPRGISCNKLQNEYRQMFKEPLNYEKYKFRSLIEMCTDLTDIFYYVQQTSDDFILYDKSNPIPSFQQNEVCEEKKIPNIDLSLSFAQIPLDVVHFLDKIPRFGIEDIIEGDYLDICVGEVYNIEKFWIFPKYGDLNLIEEELQVQFHSERNRYVIPEVFLEEGLYCVANYNKIYHRAVIVETSLKNISHIKVLFIDYGSVGEIPREKVWYLPKQFAQFPCQAVEARLANIRATDGQTINKFREMITNVDVVAEVIAINKTELVLEVYLANVTNEENIFYINDALVEKGYAEYCQ